jgi:methionyl-tRNA formyltransferase
MKQVHFFGTPEFAKIILKEITKSPGYGKEYEIKDPVFKSFSPPPDLFLIAAYGVIFTKQMLAIPKLGCFNIHASLLPNYRGASPIQAALLNGDSTTGITIIKMDEGVDTGLVLAQESLEIAPNDNYPSLSRRLAQLGAELALNSLLSRLNNLGGLSPQKGTPSYTKLIKKSDGFVTGQQIKENPGLISRMLRAYTPWPGVFTTIEELVKTRSSRDIPSLRKKRTVQILKAHLGKDGQLAIETLQIEGKKPISWKEFENGYL